jgi:hypothetical protein
LKNELVELINRDYEDFLNLNHNLVGVDTIIDDLVKPLLVIKEEAQVW